jgi:viroplasmin and RNaseH domain-containing protein
MPPKRNNKALCYAVARGRNRGIYFSWEEAEKQIHGFSSARFKSFKVIADAKTYLKSEGLTPNEPGFWLSTKRAPILYKESKKRKDGSGSSSVTSSPSQSVASMGPNAVISIDSSPESHASADDHRKR